MTELRKRMTADMISAGLPLSTRVRYVRAVRNLATHYRRPPDQLSEREVRRYVFNIYDDSVAQGAYHPDHSGIEFLFTRTLERNWSLFQDHPSTYKLTAAA